MRWVPCPLYAFSKSCVNGRFVQVKGRVSRILKPRLQHQHNLEGRMTINQSNSESRQKRSPPLSFPAFLGKPVSPSRWDTLAPLGTVSSSLRTSLPKGSAQSVVCCSHVTEAYSINIMLYTYVYHNPLESSRFFGFLSPSEEVFWIFFHVLKTEINLVLLKHIVTMKEAQS